METMIESILWVCVTSPHMKQKKAMGKMQAKKEKSLTTTNRQKDMSHKKRGICKKLSYVYCTFFEIYFIFSTRR